MPVKTCTKCGETKPLDLFSKDKRLPDGRRQPCNSCRHVYEYMKGRGAALERARKYREANQEKIRKDRKERWANRTAAEKKAEYEYQRQYRDENSERLRKTSRQYYLKNSEEIRERVRQYRLVDPSKHRERARNRRANETPSQREERLEYFRRWNKENPDRTAMLRERRRIWEAEVESDGHTIAEMHDYWEATGHNPKVCTYCDCLISNWETSVGDHVVPISKGGPDVLENLVPCCPSCNTSKGNRDLHEEWTPPNQRQPV